MEDNVHMLLEGTIAELIISLVQPERKANALCTIKKGSIQDFASHPTLLEVIIHYITGVGFYD